MKLHILHKNYPGINDINERLSAEAVARANLLMQAANLLSGYSESVFRQLKAKPESQS